MPSYTFHSLSDADFEELCRDLLQASLQLRLQSFTAGKDGGIDLLNASQDGDTVVQCKHYRKSGLATLKRRLQKGEKLKLMKLKPRRYILCTSIGLTPDNKRELVKILNPYCLSTNDIYGGDELNGLLRDHPEVETAHHKLWLTSTAVLKRILQNGAAVWNDLEHEEIKRKLALYVQTAAFDDAMEILSKFKYCVISGNPGIGKTTLAQVLVTKFVDEGYELVTARENVQEVFDAFESKRRQVIYFDDFLGRSSLGERLRKNEDEGILRLLTMASRAKNKRVILTTREYILTDARQKFDRLSGPELELAKCIIELASYTRGNRARILYNHLYFSKLPDSCISTLLAKHRYQTIIDHPNFSPRIIEWMTMGMGNIDASPSQFADHFVANLDNPQRIWENAFEHHLSSEARCLLHVLATMPGNVSLEDLEIAWIACLPTSSELSAPGERRLKFGQTLKQLDGSFIGTERVESNIAVNFHNPSVKDFVATRIGSDSRLATQLLESTHYFTQLENLMRLKNDGRLSPTATGLLDDTESLRLAIRRTIDVRSPSLQLVQYKNGGEGFVRDSTYIGRRFSQVGKWAEALRRPPLFEAAVQLFEKMLAEDAITIGVDFIGFLEVLIRSKSQERKYGELIEDLILRIDHSLDHSVSVFDWKEWGKFVFSHSKDIEFGDQTELMSRVMQFCDQKSVAIERSVDVSSEIEFWAEQIDDLGSTWKIDASPFVNRLKSAAHELRQSEPTESDSDKYERPSERPDDSDSDTAIGRLFESLRSGRN